MTAVISGLDHYHFHTGGARPSEGVLHESFANTAPMVTGVNHKHIDLTHRVLWVQSRADPPDWAVRHHAELPRYLGSRLGAYRSISTRLAMMSESRALRA